MPIKHTCIVGDNQKTAEMMLSMGRAVRLHCLECVGFSSYEVKNCSHTICAMWPFRFGKDPGRVPRELSEEQRAAMAERFRRNVHAKDKEKCDDVLEALMEDDPDFDWEDDGA